MESKFWLKGFLFGCSIGLVLGSIVMFIAVDTRVADEAKATMYYYHLSNCIGLSTEHACVASVQHNPLDEN